MGRVGLVDCLTFENDISEPPQYTRLYYFDSIFYPAQLVRLDRWVRSVGNIGGSDRWIGSVDRIGRSAVRVDRIGSAKTWIGTALALVSRG